MKYRSIFWLVYCLLFIIAITILHPNPLHLAKYQIILRLIILASTAIIIVSGFSFIQNYNNYKEMKNTCDDFGIRYVNEAYSEQLYWDIGYIFLLLIMTREKADIVYIFIIVSIALGFSIGKLLFFLYLKKQKLID